MSTVPKTMNQREARKLLETAGYVRTKGGKHAIKMAMEGKPPITLPYHGGQQYSKGLTRAILKEAGLI